MADEDSAPSRGMRTVLWIARILSALIVVFLVAFVVGYIVNPQGDGDGATVTEGFGLALFPFGLCLGYVIAWRWHLLGGIVALACLAAFLLLMREGDLVLMMAAVGVPAILYVVYGVYRRQRVPAQP